MKQNRQMQIRKSIRNGNVKKRKMNGKENKRKGKKRGREWVPVPIHVKKDSSSSFISFSRNLSIPSSPFHRKQASRQAE